MLKKSGLLVLISLSLCGLISCSKKVEDQPVAQTDETTQKTAAVDSQSENTTPSSAVSLNTTETTPSKPAVVSEKLKPGEFVKSAFDDKVNIEIVRVNRVQNRQTSVKDLVNIQFRVRKVGDGSTKDEKLNAGEITARNQEDSSEYNTSGNDHYTENPILIQSLKKNISVDAYTWLKVPEGIKSIEINVPGAAPFQNVPIEDSREEVAKTNTIVQPGKFIQTAFENRGKVELLQVNRIKTGESAGKVHVRFSISRTGDKVFGNDMFDISKITGSNINNEVYSGSHSNTNSDRIVSLAKATKTKPVEASVLLTVPDDVYSLIIRIPSTQAFNDVPIDNN